VSAEYRLPAKSVLVIDDDQDFLETVADLVSDTGRLVFTAPGASEALQLLDSAAVPRPCLVLLDWVMEPSSGAVFLHGLAARAVADVCVVVMSGDPRLHSAGEVPGILEILRKPFAMQELNALLDRYC
jgi:DNA-binding NtrC family response regulator